MDLCPLITFLPVSTWSRDSSVCGVTGRGLSCSYPRLWAPGRPLFLFSPLSQWIVFRYSFFIRYVVLLLDFSIFAFPVDGLFFATALSSGPPTQPPVARSHSVSREPIVFIPSAHDFLNPRFARIVHWAPSLVFFSPRCRSRLRG